MPSHSNESPRERFVRLATTRVNKALKCISLIGNLAERSNYSYSAEDVAKIFAALDREVRAAKLRFQSRERTEEERFKL
jgi:hypothetical protein